MIGFIFELVYLLWYNFKMFRSNCVGHMSIIENWIQSEHEIDQQFISNEKFLKLQARMNTNGVLAKINENACHDTDCIEIRESVSTEANKSMLDRIDMNRESDLMETVPIQDKEPIVIRSPSNIDTDVDLNNKFDYEVESLPDANKNQNEPPKSPQMETHNICFQTPLLKGPASEFLDVNTASEVEHLLNDDEAAATLYLDFIKISQRNGLKSSTKLMQSYSPRGLLEEEIMPFQGQDLDHIVDEIVNERILDSVVEHHDTTNDDSYYCCNMSKHTSLQNRPATVSGSLQNGQAHLIYNYDSDTTFDHPHMNYQLSEFTGFFQYEVSHKYAEAQTQTFILQSQKQYSKFQVEEDDRSYIPLDNEFTVVADTIGLTTPSTNGKEIPTAHESVENQRNVAQDHVKISDAASTPIKLHQSIETQTQTDNTQNEISEAQTQTDRPQNSENENRLANENINLYQYSQDLYKYLLYSELFKSQMLHFFCQTLVGTNNLNQLCALSSDTSTNYLSNNQNCTPLINETSSKSQTSNNQKQDLACQAERQCSVDGATEKSHTNNVELNYGDKRVILKPGLQNANKFRKRSKALTENNKTIKVKKLKNKENQNKDEYKIENLDDPSSEENWLDPVPRKINFGPSKRDCYRTPKRFSKYIRKNRNVHRASDFD